MDAAPAPNEDDNEVFIACAGVSHTIIEPPPPGPDIPTEGNAKSLDLVTSDAGDVTLYIRGYETDEGDVWVSVWRLEPNNTFIHVVDKQLAAGVSNCNVRSIHVAMSGKLQMLYSAGETLGQGNLFEYNGTDDSITKYEPTGCNLYRAGFDLEGQPWAVWSRLNEVTVPYSDIDQFWGTRPFDDLLLIWSASNAEGHGMLEISPLPSVWLASGSLILKVTRVAGLDLNPALLELKNGEIQLLQKLPQRPDGTSFFGLAGRGVLTPILVWSLRSDDLPDKHVLESGLQTASLEEAPCFTNFSIGSSQIADMTSYCLALQEFESGSWISTAPEANKLQTLYLVDGLEQRRIITPSVAQPEFLNPGKFQLRSDGRVVYTKERQSEYRIVVTQTLP